MAEVYKVRVRITPERPTGEVVLTDEGHLPFTDYINDPETRITDERVAADLARHALGRALGVERAHRQPGEVTFDLTVDQRPAALRDGYNWGLEPIQPMTDA